MNIVINAFFNVLNAIKGFFSLNKDFIYLSIIDIFQQK